MCVKWTNQFYLNLVHFNVLINNSYAENNVDAVKLAESVSVFMTLPSNILSNCIELNENKPVSIKISRKTFLM